MARFALPLWLALVLLAGGCASHGPKATETDPAAEGRVVTPPGYRSLDAPQWSEEHTPMMFAIEMVEGVFYAIACVACFFANAAGPSSH